jgi:hypothetical protein
MLSSSPVEVELEEHGRERLDMLKDLRSVILFDDGN